MFKEIVFILHVVIKWLGTKKNQKTLNYDRILVSVRQEDPYDVLLFAGIQRGEPNMDQR